MDAVGHGSSLVVQPQTLPPPGHGEHEPLLSDLMPDILESGKNHQNHQNNQGLCRLFLTLSWDLRAWHCICQRPCFSVVPEATHEASRGLLKGAVSAQKTLQGPEMEMRELLGGTEENSVSPMRGH